MATFYWVRGSGTWGNTSTTNLSTTSGGAPASATPTGGDLVIFDANSNSLNAGASYTVTVNRTTSMPSLSLDNPSAGTLTFAGSSNLNYNTTDIHSITISSGVNWTNTGTIAVSAANGRINITTNGVTLRNNLSLTSASDELNLGSALVTTGSVTINNMRVNLQGFDLTCDSLSNAAAIQIPINFDSGGQVYITGNNKTVLSVQFGAYSGRSNLPFTLTYTGSVGTRTVTYAGSTFSGAQRNGALTITGGSDTVSFNGAVNTLNCTGFSGAFNLGGAVSIAGNATFGSGNTGSANTLTFLNSTTLSSNGGTINFAIAITNTRTVTLGSAVSFGTARTVAAGTGLNISSYTLTLPALTANGGITSAGGTIALTGTGTVFTNATTITGAPSILFSDNGTTQKTFAGNGATYGDMTLGGSTGIATYNFTGANNWTGTWSSTKTVASTIVLPASVTTTVRNWNISGSPSNLITLQSSTAGTRATLSKSGGGIVSTADYLDIRDSSAAPTSVLWYAGANSVNTSNNIGWIFAAYPEPNYNFLQFFNGP
jgi:hypothetical protein